MFNLIPWKKRDKGGAISDHRAEPTRQDLGFHSPTRFREEFDSILNRFFDDAWIAARSPGLPRLWDSPRFDRDFGVGWKDEQKEYVFRAELPGFEPEHFNLNVSGNTLTVRAEHKDEENDKNGGSSYRYGSFVRTMTIPHGVDVDNIDARYHSGVLEVHLPKTEQAEGKRIPVIAN